MITVIVPIHNTKQYVKECLDSIRNQTDSDLEILCIDSSTDETTDIVKECSAQDPRICHILDADNSYGYKLNRGIRAAKGEYIGIVDSDDYIEKGMYRRLREAAEESRADFVKADHSSFYAENGKNVVFRYDRTIANPDWYGRPVSCRDIPEILYRISVSIWSGLYRTAFLRKNHIAAHESPAACFQDTGFSTFTYLYADRICHLNESYYRYRTDNADSSVKSADKANAIIEEFRWIDGEAAKRGFTSAPIQQALTVKKLSHYYWNYNRLDSETARQFAGTVREELKELFVDTGLRETLVKDKRLMFDKLWNIGVPLGNDESMQQ